jgi:hypothetical protein
MKKPKTEVVWHLCHSYKSDGKVRTKRHKKKSKAAAVADAVWYSKRRDWFNDIWIERHEITTTPAERIEVVADGHED